MIQTLRVRLAAAATLIAAAACMIVGSCHTSPSLPALPLRGPNGRPPSVLLISIDTLRTDYLGAWGSGPGSGRSSGQGTADISPAIDALAASGVSFDTAVASSTETSPAVASMISGLYPLHTELASNLWVLPDKVTTLGGMFSKAGYVTSAVVANILVGPKFGFGKDFNSFEVVKPPAFAEPVDNIVVDHALAWLDGREQSSPWFLWLHLMDPHGPYTTGDTEWIKGLSPSQGAINARPIPLSDSNFGLGVVPRYQVLKGINTLGDYTRRYKGEIRASDEQIGRLLAGLRKRGLIEDTLIVLTADHGESLSEHKEFLQHGWYVYDTTARVPLLFSMPGAIKAGQRIEQPVCSVDLVPTIAELVGLKTVDAKSLDGISLASTIATGDEPQDRPCFTVGGRDNRPFAMRQNGYKVIQTRAGGPPRPGLNAKDGPYSTPGKIELYNLSADPGETRNLAQGLAQNLEEDAQHKQRLEAMLSRLDEHHEAYRDLGFPW